MSYYNEKVIDDIDPIVVLNPAFEDWFEIVEDILRNDEFQKRKLFIHHHDLSVWDHSIFVSFRSYVLAGVFHCDQRVCAIAGLLHDFYPLAWQYNEELAKLDNGKYMERLKRKEPLFKKHGFTHGAEAAENYIKFFPELEDKKITDSIRKHMFPLTIKPPKYKEGFIITLVDKANTVHELPSVSVLPIMIKCKMDAKLFKKSYNKNEL
jgi:uncharacterized protein